ncbi:MAG: hypothetical protein ACFFF4_02920 [Candidatus Thorarchaeota archaeon]
MAEATNKRLISITILVLFIIFLTIPIIFIMTGFMWYELTQGQIVLWLTFNTMVGSVAAGVVFIYSLERYKQEQLFTYLLLVMTCITLMIGAVLYLITSPAFINLSPFVDRNRNRCIMMLEGLTLATSPLLGSLERETPIRQHEKLLLILLNIVVGPILQIYSLFSPVQLFTLYSEELGPFQYAPVDLVVFGFLIVLLIMSMIKSLRAYYINRVSIHLALAVLLALIMVVGILFSSRASPMSVLECTAHSVYIEGFVIVSISFMMDVVVDPFGTLKALVTRRTEELEESKRESEYYLSIWSHKVGNLLQGLQLYLELLSSASDQQDIMKFSQSSLMLVKDVEAINRQVSILSRIKGRQTKDLIPVSINDAIKAAICEINGIFGDSAPEIRFSEFMQDDYVLGDELLSTIPFNIIMYIIIYQTLEKSKISVSLSENQDYMTAHIQYEGKPISEDVLTALYDSLDPSRTTMGLDLYAVKVLLKDYGGTFTHEESPLGGQFLASIKKSPVERSDRNHVELRKPIDT